MLTNQKNSYEGGVTLATKRAKKVKQGGGGTCTHIGRGTKRDMWNALRKFACATPNTK